MPLTMQVIIYPAEAVDEENNLCYITDGFGLSAVVVVLRRIPGKLIWTGRQNRGSFTDIILSNLFPSAALSPV